MRTTGTRAAKVRWLARESSRVPPISVLLCGTTIFLRGLRHRLMLG